MVASTHSPGLRKPQSFAEPDQGASGPSIDPADVARFSAQAAEWWDVRGPFAPLHRFNPARLAFVRRTAIAHFGRESGARAPFHGLSLLDVGCGGGLIAEPMRRMGFDVTAVDASAENIGTARAHADMVGLDITYASATVEQLVARGAGPFDVVLTMEVVEHVADPGAFLRDCASLVRPGGLLVVATLNRTLKALALGKVAAEYVLRWVPAGTHDWTQFLKPEEVRTMLAETGLTITGPFGLEYDLLSDHWREGDADINYMMVATRD